MNQEAEKYLESVKFTLNPDLVSEKLVESLLELEILRLFLCPGGRGRSIVTATIITRYGMPSIGLGLGLGYLSEVDEKNQSRIIDAINLFPTIAVIMDKFEEAPLYRTTLPRILVTNSFEDFDPAVNHFTSGRQ